MSVRDGFTVARVRPEASGDRGAIDTEFDEAFANEERRLLAIALSILRNPTDAEDAVQATAVRAWRAWRQQATEGSTRRWLTTICVRQCITRRRVLQRTRAMTAELTEHVPYGASGSVSEPGDPDLDRAYTKLSKRQRAVISLHYGQGYPLAECADLMRCSAGTVASHLSRALTKLRKELANE